MADDKVYCFVYNSQCAGVIYLVPKETKGHSTEWSKPEIRV